MKKGFTLIETLFAILILTIAIAGPMTIAAHGLDAALISKDQTTAFYLAQDAIEYIRYKRDSACLPYSTATSPTPCPSTSWIAGLSACTSPNTCVIDSVANTVAAYTGQPLNYDSTTGWYAYSGNAGDTLTPSIFTRSVEVTWTPGSSEATASATVSWQDVGGKSHLVTVQEDIFDWQ